MPTAGDGPPTALRLSASRAETYRRCARQYRHSHIDGFPVPPSPSLSFDSTVHAVLRDWWSQKLPEPPPVAHLHRTLHDRWDDTGFAGMPRDEKVDGWYRRAQTVLAGHHARHAAGYRPAVAVGEWFHLDLGDDIEVVGTVDRLALTDAGGFAAIDWRTGRRAKAYRDVVASFQPAIHVLACRELWGAEIDVFACEFVDPGVTVEVPRAAIDVDGAVGRLRDTAARIRSGEFLPSPSRLCGWCDYRALCPAYDGDGPDAAAVAADELDRARRERKGVVSRIGELEVRVPAGAAPTPDQGRPGV